MTEAQARSVGRAIRNVLAVVTMPVRVPLVLLLWSLPSVESALDWLCTHVFRGWERR